MKAMEHTALNHLIRVPDAIHTGTLAAGTSGGGVVMWTWIPPQAGGGDGKKHVPLSDHWELLATSSLTGPLVQLKVCPSYN